MENTTIEMLVHLKHVRKQLQHSSSVRGRQYESAADTANTTAPESDVEREGLTATARVRDSDY